ncbi:hypothetical protein G7B40_003710 [Aetokthonos hydrillicola Thurmond2011]|uniref:Uncharacterized protein n=1 Tax=Aetokthonos hydrillicola Thurmond2011 TaxID=2712845 RepID=A0AAP5I2V4_9CYAN|nr:hypothetical protein [Aetokthonos hydrillicola]MDR9893686.1 hypothetical protein [Aetokthonos hydrillicola Thurmond2011]
MKSFWTILATATASLLTATFGVPSSALASRAVFNCSAEGVIVEVSRLSDGTLRYKAYNIPTDLRRPNLVIDGGTVGKNSRGDTVYRFRNRNYLYVAVKDENYGRVLVYKNNQLIATKPCGDV